MKTTSKFPVHLLINFYEQISGLRISLRGFPNNILQIESDFKWAIIVKICDRGTSFLCLMYV